MHQLSLTLGGLSLPTIYVGASVAVPKNLLASEARTKSDLTIRNHAKFAAIEKGIRVGPEVPDSFCMWREDAAFLYTPRAYKLNIRDELRDGRHYKIKVLIPEPREAVLGDDLVTLGPNQWQAFDQGPAFEALSAPRDWPFGRCLVLRPGAGKTAVALKAAHERGGRVLWVTVSLILVQQARKEICKFYGLNDKQVGHIQAAKERWNGYGVAVATLQSLALKRYSRAFWHYWDTVIFDEGDALATNKFHRVAGRFIGERWLLTATPNRDDKMDALFQLHTGPVCYAHSGYELKPKVWFIEDDHCDESCVVKVGWNARTRQKNIQFALTSRNLLQDAGRNAHLAQLIKEATDVGRVCLVLGDSIAGLLEARRQVMKLLPTVTQGLLTSRIRQKQRADVISKNQVVWATTTIANRGLDRPAFDTLFVATISASKDNLWRQGGGRILRTADKRPPRIIVLYERHIPALRMMAAKLALIFKKEKWPVENADKLITERALRIREWADREKEERHGSGDHRVRKMGRGHGVLRARPTHWSNVSSGQ